MKKLIIVMLAFMGQYCHAADASFVRTGGGADSVVGILADENLSYNRSYYLTPDQYSMPKISAIVTYTSATIAAVTFSSNSYAIGGTAITIPAHGLNTGLIVTFSNGAGTDPGGLTDGADYYVGYVGTNSIGLASSQANAIAGTYIVLTSSTSGNDETYTLTPKDIAGTPSFKWEAKNDLGDKVDVAITSVTVSEYTYGGAKVGFDFGEFNYSTLILSVTAPTAGALDIKAIINMKE
jgi:hypothetical protein